MLKSTFTCARFQTAFCPRACIAWWSEFMTLRHGLHHSSLHAVTTTNLNMHEKKNGISDRRPALLFSSAHDEKPGHTVNVHFQLRLTNSLNQQEIFHIDWKTNFSSENMSSESQVRHNILASLSACQVLRPWRLASIRYSPHPVPDTWRLISQRHIPHSVENKTSAKI